MAAMFVGMVWHARRRLSAMEETERVSMENLRLLERERRFVQDASHELRTPITVALGHAELIQRRATDPTIVEDVDVIADELARLRRLVDGLLLLVTIFGCLNRLWLLYGGRPQTQRIAWLVGFRQRACAPGR